MLIPELILVGLGILLDLAPAIHQSLVLRIRLEQLARDPGFAGRSTHESWIKPMGHQRLMQCETEEIARRVKPPRCPVWRLQLP